VLAIDYGSRRIGLAISDPLGIVAQGLQTIEYERLEEALCGIQRIVEEFEVGEVVVGLPLTMKGQEGARAAEVRDFISALQQRLSIRIIPWDERLTSVEAERVIREFGHSPSRTKARVDQLSAILILQNYLNYLQHRGEEGSEEGKPPDGVRA